MTFRACVSLNRTVTRLQVRLFPIRGDTAAIRLFAVKISHICSAKIQASRMENYFLENYFETAIEFARGLSPVRTRRRRRSDNRLGSDHRCRCIARNRGHEFRRRRHAGVCRFCRCRTQRPLTHNHILRKTVRFACFSEAHTQDIHLQIIP